MKITAQHRRDIRAAVSNMLGCGFRLEVGLRSTADGYASANGLLWAPEADLWDTRGFAGLAAVQDDPRRPGAALLDLYVYTLGRRGELDRNVYVTIAGGNVVDVHSQDLEADARARAIVGRGYGDAEPAELGQ